MAVAAPRTALAAVVLLAAACAPLVEIAFDRTPVTVDTPIGFSTRSRLMQATADPAACEAWLTTAGVAFTPVQDRSQSEFCSVTAAGVVSELGAPSVRLSPRRPMMTCQLAAALALWRRQSVEPAAEELLGASVREIDHLGVYACRPINGGPAGRPSAHARAAAIDVAGFRLTDGRAVTVSRYWSSEGAEGRFLRRIRNDACEIFGTTLSPDYNAAHANHLHLEAGPGGACS